MTKPVASSAAAPLCPRANGNCAAMDTSTTPTAPLVIIGGGPAGHAAAESYRKSGGVGAVRMYSADTALPYQRPPLSKTLLRGESDERDLPIEAAGYYRDQGIEVTLDDPVVRLDAAARLLTTRAGRTEHYRTCILATGCVPATLPVPGAEHAHLLRFFAQALALREHAERASSALVIGSGFIGCEAAASLAARGMTVTMLSNEGQPQLQRLGPDAAHQLARWLEQDGVRVLGGVNVASIDDPHTVRLQDGRSLTADLILSATGVVPQTVLAEQAGADLRNKRVAVDEHMCTSVQGLLAAGDVVMARNAAAGRHLTVEHWGEALRMGEVAGATAAGRQDSWAQVPGFWSEIGTHQLKYAAWGDGYDQAVPVERPDGGFTVWYARDGAAVGVLTYLADDDYDRGSALIEAGSPVPA